jgi:hypothetical protein
MKRFKMDPSPDRAIQRVACAPQVMYIKDVSAPELDRKSMVLKFRIGKPLRHFIDSYDCTDPQHILSLTFHEKADAAQFQELLTTKCKVALQVVGAP